MARAKKGSRDRREAFVGFRASASEVEALRKLAEGSGMSLSNFARQSLLAAPEEQAQSEHPQLSPHQTYAVRELAEQVRRIGVNLNQIAHQLNMDKRFHSPDMLAVALDETRSLLRSARQFMP